MKSCLSSFNTCGSQLEASITGLDKQNVEAGMKDYSRVISTRGTQLEANITDLDKQNV